MVSGIAYIAPNGPKVIIISILHHGPKSLTAPPGPCTQGQQYQSLCKEEMDNELAGKGVSGATAFVNNGLHIEAEMCVAEIRYIYLILILIAYQASYCKTHCNWGSVIHTTEKNNKGSHETPTRHNPVAPISIQALPKAPRSLSTRGLFNTRGGNTCTSILFHFGHAHLTKVRCTHRNRV